MAIIEVNLEIGIAINSKNSSKNLTVALVFQIMVERDAHKKLSDMIDGHIWNCCAFTVVKWMTQDLVIINLSMALIYV